MRRADDGARGPRCLTGLPPPWLPRVEAGRWRTRGRSSGLRAESIYEVEEDGPSSYDREVRRRHGAQGLDRAAGGEGI